MEADRQPLIFHIDVNSAYLSWESVRRLNQGETMDLRTIPSIIGGDREKRHGIVLAKSTLAKKAGVQTGEPIVSALKKCPGLTIIPPDFDLYTETSDRFMEILKRYAPAVEQYSIDEAFLDMTGTQKLYGSYKKAAELIQNTIWKELGFTVNIGISVNKLLAKMASDFEKPNKIHTLFPEEIQKKMWPLPVRSLFFVGDSAERKLKELGIHTIGELAQSDPQLLAAHLKKHGQTLYQYANGLDTSDILHKEPLNKGCGNSVTLPHDVTDAEYARTILLSLTESVCARLRADGNRANTVTVQITYSNFVNKSRQCTLSASTNVTNELYGHVCTLFHQLWDAKTGIRLLGVQAGKISTEEYRQYNLFDRGRYEKLEKLDGAIDSIRSRFGEDAVKRAAFLNQTVEIRRHKK